MAEKVTTETVFYVTTISQRRANRFDALK